MSQLRFDGLNGSNPLGFLAGLGVVNACSDAGRPVRLAWEEGAWTAVLHADWLSRDALLELLVGDVKSFREEAALQLRYEKDKGKQAWDLKPPPAVFIEHVERVLTGTGPASRRGADFLAALATDVAVDGKGNTKPTALHFTAGQQEFLAMFGELAGGVNAADFEEALFGPWRYASPLPVFGWDSSSNRSYALLATNPADEKLGVPGADWLALRGLSFMRVAPKQDEIQTTGCEGGWKTGSLAWPVWSTPLSADMIHVAVQLPGLREMPENERRVRGITACFEARINRSAQGGYGSFAPARAC